MLKNMTAKESVKAGAHKVAKGLATGGECVVAGTTCVAVGVMCLGVGVGTGVIGTVNSAGDIIGGLGMMTVVPAAIGVKNVINKKKTQKVKIVKAYEIEEILEAAEVC